MDRTKRTELTVMVMVTRGGAVVVQERAGRKIGFYLCAGIQKRVVRNAAVGGAL